MIEELYQMYKRAKAEANARAAAGDWRGYAEMAVFAFSCKEFANDLLLK